MSSDNEEEDAKKWPRLSVPIHPDVKRELESRSKAERRSAGREASIRIERSLREGSKGAKKEND